MRDRVEQKDRVMRLPGGMRNWILVSVNAAIFYFLISWIAKNINPSLLIEQLNTIPTMAIIFLLLANLVILVFLSLRLSILVAKPFHVTFQIINLGYGFNAILPMRLGDLARIHYAKQYFNISSTKLLANGVIEKYFDLLLLGLLTLVSVLLGGNTYINASLSILIFGLVLALYLLWYLFHRFSSQIAARAHKLEKLNQFLIALKAHSTVQNFPMVIACTIAIWGASLLAVNVGFSGFLPLGNIGIYHTLSLLIITALAVAIPGAPAGLGVFEAGVVAYLTQALHVGNEVALASAIVFHLAIAIPPLVISLMIFLNIGRKKLRISK